MVEPGRPTGLNGRVADDVQLVDFLTSRTPAELAVVLRHRPDVRRGSPIAGMQDLADRMNRPDSVLQALHRLVVPSVQVLHALLLSGPRPLPRKVVQLLEPADRSPQEQLDALMEAIDQLQQHALAWYRPDGTVTVEPSIRHFISRPLAIGISVTTHLANCSRHDVGAMCTAWRLPARGSRAGQIARLEAVLTDHDRVRAAVAGAPGAVRARLEQLADAQATGRSIEVTRGRAEVEGEIWAKGRGLLFGGGGYYLPAMPAEVVLAVRPAPTLVPFHPHAPAGLTRPVAPGTLRAGAAAAAGDFTQSVAALVDRLTRIPATGLKMGGVGARELIKIGRALHLDESRVRFGFELLRELQLLSGAAGTVRMNTAAPDWRADDPGARYADLVVVWWSLPVHPTVGRDSDDKVVPAAGGRAVTLSAELLRRTVLSLIAELPSGHGLADAEALAETVTWRRPNIPIGAHDVDAVWREAHDLGALVDGSLSPIGRCLLDADPDRLLAVAGELIAPATSMGRFGSDLTVVVAGSPSAAVSTLLDACADREGRGAAVIWRFSPTSVRRAFDEGWTAERLTSALRGIADLAENADLPQPLTYLIADVDRRHGHLMVFPAACCVRSREPALLREVVAHRALQKLLPHLVTEQVAVFQQVPAVVVRSLRDAGFLPVPADEHGLVDLGRGADAAHPGPRRRSSSPAADRAVRRLVRDPVPEPVARTEAFAAELLRRVDRVEGAEPLFGAEELIAMYTAHLEPLERRQLAYAIENGLPVVITYRSATGGRTTRMISDLELTGDVINAWCHLRDDQRAFNLTRISSVAPAKG